MINNLKSVNVKSTDMNWNVVFKGQIRKSEEYQGSEVLTIKAGW